jgi:hypothetical protein
MKPSFKRALFGFAILILFFIMPIFTLESTYKIFYTHLYGKTVAVPIVKKNKIGRRASKAKYYAFANIANTEVKIKLPKATFNANNIGDTLVFKYIEGNNFGVYNSGIYPYNFIANLLLLFLGIFIIYRYFLLKR